jgi:hypothetical protein
MSESRQQALVDILTTGPKTPAEIRARTGFSQPTLSRAIQDLSGEIVSSGKGKAVTYGLIRQLRLLERAIPVNHVDESGVVRPYAHLYALYGGSWCFSRQPAMDWKQFPANEFFDGIPPWIVDLRPQGFMGRQFPARHAELQLPERINDWSDDDTIAAVASRGEDLPGNLLVGTASFQRWFALKTRQPDAIDAAERHTHYPDMARRALQGAVPGSSAGGEQAKFGALVRRIDNTQAAANPGEPPDHNYRHTLVKFSRSGAASVALRWSDLLIAEHWALRQIQASGILDAAASSLLFAGDHTFLEVERFDRIGLAGRRGVVSLGAIDDCYIGKRDNWGSTARRLAAKGMITQADADAIRWQEEFGKLIGNTDQHYGNLLLFNDGERLSRAPAYDMLPMMYSPATTGEVVEKHYQPQLPSPDNLDVFGPAWHAAAAFWEQVIGDQRISNNFRQIAERHLSALMTLRSFAR